MDMYLNENHDIVLSGRDLRLTTTDEDVKQRLAIALQFLREEWFLNTNIGVPFTQIISNASKADVETLTAIYRKIINRVEGITAINSLEFEFGGDNRILTVLLTVNKTITVEVSI